MRLLITLLTLISIASFGQEKQKLDSVKLNDYNIAVIQSYQKKIDSLAKPYNEKIKLLIETKIAEKINPKNLQYGIRNGYIVFIKPE